LSQLLDLYRSLGNQGYGEAIAGIAPYFGTITPRFLDFQPHYCALSIANTHAVRNHLGTLHAIAMCNGAELAAGLVTDASIPPGRRWIPVEMNVRYLAKAKTDVTVVCDGRALDWSLAGNIAVPVTISDADGKDVVTAVITMNVTDTD
jgi:acyl-coenzyme A thioesterase PaaI-like protein